MKTLEFRKIKTSDRCDIKYGAWSRIYEYPLVMDMIEKHGNSPKYIHNSSWGFEGCHVIFKEDLDGKYKVLHTDIKGSNLPNTDVWDITTSNKKYDDLFDVVINVSTVEEVNFDHITIFNNLFNQVKKGGILILTFDLPGMQLDKFEKLLGQKIVTFDDEINGNNSQIPNPQFGYLTCGLLVIQKI